MGLEVKTTSNAQFSEKRLKTLMEHGLKSFNFSVLGLNSEQFLSTQKNKSIKWAEENTERQKNIIAKTIELGGKVKINTVISSINDIPKGIELYDFAKKKGIVIRFLNDLNAGRSAVEAIIDLVENKIGAKKFKEKVIIGSSSKLSYYRDGTGYEFGVKEIADNKLQSLCKDCNEKCTEQFYGIRLEKKDGKFFVRLCVDRHDKKSYMPLEDFLQSDQLQEILDVLNN